MKIATIMVMALCAMATHAWATTLPPAPETQAAKVTLMPLLPAPAANRFERDYFQAPQPKDEWAGQFYCRAALRIRTEDRPVCD
ncbi:MAG: hypothetical protein ACR2K5_01660 [Pseudolabrys sp.]